MRLGLVAVGTAFSVVGAAVIAGLLCPASGPTLERSSSADVDGLKGGSWKPFVLNASSSDHASLSLRWSANTGQPSVPAAVNVSLFAAYPCPPLTCHGAALVTWGPNGSGTWSDSRSVGAMYELVVAVLGTSNVSVNFSATFVEQYSMGPTPLPMLPFAVIMVGGGLLTGVGAVALYLGLFLPAGVYDAANESVPDEGPFEPGPGPTDEDAREPPGPAGPD